MSGHCPRESEVAAAVIDERRRFGADRTELMAHTDMCDVCREVEMITRLLVDDRENARREIRVPAAGQVWWRAAVRARLEAVHAAARPLTLSNGIAGACAIGLVVGVLGLSWPFIRETAASLTAHALTTFPVAEAAALLSGSLRQSLAVMVCAGACIILAPFVLYLALSDD